MSPARRVIGGESSLVRPNTPSEFHHHHAGPLYAHHDRSRATPADRSRVIALLALRGDESPVGINSVIAYPMMITHESLP